MHSKSETKETRGEETHHQGREETGKWRESGQGRCAGLGDDRWIWKYQRRGPTARGVATSYTFERA